MCYSPDSTSLITGGADNLARIFSLKSNFCTHNLKGKCPVSAICYVKEDTVIIGYADGVAKHFDLTKSGKTSVDIPGHTSQITEILPAAVDGHPESVVVVSRDRTYSIYDFAADQKVKVIPIFEPVEGAVILDNKLVTVGEEGVVKVFDVFSGKRLASRKISSQRIDAILDSPNTSSLVCVTCDQNIIVIDNKSLVITRQFVGFNDEIFSASYVSSEENKFLVVGTNSSDLRIYNVVDWSCNLIHGHKDCVLATDSPKWNNHMFASSSKDGNIFMWTVADSQVKLEPVDSIDELEPPVLARHIGIASGHTSGVSDVKFCHSKRDSPFMVSVSYDKTLKIWALSDLLKVVGGET